MKYVPRDATNEQILTIIREWIDLLAREDYQAAFDAIDPQGIHGEWKPEYLRDDIKNYHSRELYPGVKDFRVTDWRTAQGGNPKPQQKVGWFHDDDFPLAGAVSFDLPLNGQWSNLSADFVFWKNDSLQEGYPLYLEEISSWQQRAEADTAADKASLAP